MAVRPPVKAIADQQSWRVFDRSGIEYDVTKLQSMPGSLAECDGYREHCTEEDGWVVERTYLCNWSDAAAAIQWLRGYSMASPGGGGLTRIPPAQDPYRPWLYCMRAELVEPIGVPLQDPGLVTSTTIQSNPEEDAAVAAEDIDIIIEPAPPVPEPIVGIELGPAPGGTQAPRSEQAPTGGLDTITVGGESGTGLNEITATEEDEAPIPAGGEEDPEEIVATTYIPGTVWAEKGYQFESDAFSDGKAKIRAVFRAVPYVIRSDAQQANSQDAQTQGELCRYVERVPRYAIQGIPLATLAAKNQLAYANTAPNPIVIPEAGVLLMPTASWHYIWHDVPFYPSVAIEAVVGKVNQKAFDGVAGWPSFPAGTLLCQSPEIHMKRNASGQAAFDITWILDFRPQGWNNFPIVFANGKFDFNAATFGGGPVAADGSNLVFHPADFGLLFAPGPQILFV